MFGPGTSSTGPPSRWRSASEFAVPYPAPRGGPVDDNIYSVIVYIHIVAAIAWVGGSFFLQLLGIRTARSTDPDDLPKLGRQIEWFGLRYFLPVSVVTFAAGVILVSQRWQFSQL